MPKMTKQPRRDEVRPEELDAYDRVCARQAAYGYEQSQTGYESARKPEEIAGPYFGFLLRSPLIADHISELGVVYRTRGEFPGSYAHKDREWIDIVLGRELGLNMWGHVADGMAVGVRPEAVIALMEDRRDDLTDDERECADYIQAFARGSVTNEQWKAILERFGERGAVEYTAFIAHLIMIIRTIQLIRVTSDELTGAILTDRDVVERVKKVVDGEIELPDPLARIPSLEPPAPVG